MGFHKLNLKKIYRRVLKRLGVISDIRFKIFFKHFIRYFFVNRSVDLDAIKLLAFKTVCASYFFENDIYE